MPGMQVYTGYALTPLLLFFIGYFYQYSTAIRSVVAAPFFRSAVLIDKSNLLLKN